MMLSSVSDQYCDVCYSVLCVIVVPLPPGINPLAVVVVVIIIINISASSVDYLTFSTNEAVLQCGSIFADLYNIPTR
jgi:hypothetical protein